jgi:hypothetical protein
MSDWLDDYIKERGFRFRLTLWWTRHVRFPREQRQWDRAVKVIRDCDYYVISDHEYFAGVRAGLWDEPVQPTDSEEAS